MMFLIENEKQKLIKDKNDQTPSIVQKPPKLSAEPIKTEKVNKQNQIGRNLITNIKIEVVEQKPDENNSQNDDSFKKIKQTLLEKAMVYRKQNPEKWQQRVMENQRRMNESLGVFEPDAFLDDYYKTLTEAMRNKERQQQKKGVRYLKIEISVSEIPKI